MFVADYMTLDPVTATGDMLLAQAHDVMERHRVRHLPVVDEGGRLVGILSDRDVRSAMGFDRTLGEKLTVAETMTAEPVAIAANATLDEALAILAPARFGALPVVRGGRVVGILTRSDILRAFAAVLGLDLPSKQIEVALPNGCNDLVNVFDALSGCHEVISAVVSRMRKDSGEPSLYLRVAGKDSRGIEERLHRAAAIVLKPEHIVAHGRR